MDDTPAGTFASIVNLTPHDIHLRTAERGLLTIPRSGIVARVAVREEQVRTLHGVPVCRVSYGTVEHLPEPSPGVWYVVSLLVRQAAPDREDLLSPGEPIRDDAGRIVGCATLHWGRP